MQLTFPMPSGPVCGLTYPPEKLRQDYGSTPCAMFSTPSCTSSVVAVPGASCRTTFLHGLPFTTTSERFRLDGLWSLILKVVHAAERKRVGKDPQPTAAIMDSQSVKTTEESAHPSGYDAHKNIKGRKRHLLVDTLGLPLSVYVTSADVQDRVGAQCLLAGLTPFVPRLNKIWADGAYTGEKLAG
jgi:hypothetical protein